MEKKQNPKNKNKGIVNKDDEDMESVLSKTA